jgi:hypothetical protein
VPQGQALLLSRSGRKRCRRLLPSQIPLSKGRDGRGLKTMEEIMRLLTISELSRYSCTTLRALAARMASAIAALPPGSIERDNAFVNLRTIRWVLARRELSPR